MDGFTALLSEVRARVDAKVGDYLRPRVASAAQISEEVGAVANAVLDLALRGGKRMRAALVAAGYEAFATGPALEGAPSWSVCDGAMIAVELLQTYLLIHDDWMDDDDVRRGGPAVHVLLREKLGARALGDAAAILAGDLASGYAQEALVETPLPPERVLRASRAFARIQVDVVTGQVAEMLAAARTGALPSVETIHALKTASYTVIGPLLLGAALAGADDARCAELERFGRPLGIAFQLRDDLLGVFGDPSATGKPVWNDIRQGKRTALVAELRGDPRAEALLERVHGKPDAKEADIDAVVRAMEETGARARVEARVRELCDEARCALDAMTPSMSEVGRLWLAGAVTALGDRSS
ncbi:MAG TPA: polyprenyl synthetase family protein [Labilithrix sp.]|nr:polyprenyl synthetase family protein [Labilithrix sp.]